jgi:ATP-dependent DNA helicase RecG
MSVAGATQRILEGVGRGQPASALESQTLEFKECARGPKETFNILADAAVCFANADGATIVLGVNNKATTRELALVGVDASYTIDAIRRGIFDRTAPPITVAASEHLEDGIRLVLIEVLPTVAPHFHATTSGKATRRLGTECRPFTPEQQREVLVARGQIDWSAESSGLTVRDLSAAEFERMRRLLRAAGESELAALRDRPLMDALRLMARDDKVTNAGALLLAPEERLAEVLRRHGFSYQYRPSPGSEATSRFRSQRPLLQAIDELLEAVERRAEIRPLNIAGGLQLTLTDYPPNAVREVVVNALIHRSYEIEGSVDVEHSPERVVVMSPGGLVSGVTPANILTHPSTPRNRLLAEAFARLRLAERTGQGIDRAYREMLQAGKELPTINDDGLTVQALLPGGIGNDSFVRFVRELPDSLGRDVEVLITLSLLRTARSIDAPALATAIQRSPVEAQDLLARLAADEAGLLEPTRRTLNKTFPSYRLRGEAVASLARAVSYHRHTRDQTEAKVVEHVAEYGFITNRTLQRLFDVHVYAARNMLTDLRSRGILEKVGSAKGGRGIRYVPGPNFPSQESLKHN